ncbi:ABC transporter substrate-binding protein [Polaromonas sp.]|uniref:ABC transporter substrate-binding protein n=1 Tax=Polaromonas sp. TaxID=1869339 RepID=UPI00286AF9BA|nr:ABC transporter substrate-binding protein [Polaromonas sp.]
MFIFIASPRFRYFFTVCLLAVLQSTAFTAHAADTIVVGRSLALSGPLKSYGEAKRDGGDAYINKVNAAGGVGGKKIELITLDDVYTPATTVENLKKISIDRNPTAFLGLFGVPTVAAALPVLLELKVPAIGLTSGTDALRTPLNRYAFPVRASYADEARKLVNHVKTVNITKVSVIYTTNPFGESVKNTLLVALKDAGINAKTFKVDPTGTDAAESARLANTDEPQAIFMTMLSQAALPVLMEVKKTSFRGALYTFSPVDTSTITKQLGEKANGLAITQVVPIPNGVRIKVVSEYVQALTELGRGTPSFYGLEAFIEAKVMVEGLKRAGANPTPASLVKSLETLRDFDLGGYFVTYKPDSHTGSLFVDVNVINSFGEVKR